MKLEKLHMQPKHRKIWNKNWNYQIFSFLKNGLPLNKIKLLGKLSKFLISKIEWVKRWVFSYFYKFLVTLDLIIINISSDNEILSIRQFTSNFVSLYLLMNEIIKHKTDACIKNIATLSFFWQFCGLIKVCDLVFSKNSNCKLFAFALIAKDIKSVTHLRKNCNWTLLFQNLITNSMKMLWKMTCPNNYTTPAYNQISFKLMTKMTNYNETKI